MTARDHLMAYALVCFDGSPPPIATAHVNRLADAYRAETLREAADLLRDLYFGQGYSVQEIGTAVRHMAAALERSEDR